MNPQRSAMSSSRSAARVVEVSVQRTISRISPKESSPAGVPAGPALMAKPEPKLPEHKHRHYFRFKKGAVMVCTLEFPYAPKGREMNPPALRAYGEAILNAWVPLRGAWRDGARAPSSPACDSEGRAAPSSRCSLSPSAHGEDVRPDRSAAAPGSDLL